MTKRNKRIAAGVVLAIALYWLISSIFAVDVVVARARKDTAIMAVNGTVTVLAEVETQLLSTGHGFITTSNLVDGMAFSKGDVLAVIDPGSLLFQIESIKAEIKSAEVDANQGSSHVIDLRSAERELEYAQELVTAGHISREEYQKLVDARDMAQNQVEAGGIKTEATLEVKKNLLAEHENQLSRLTIRAPMDGRISQIKAYPGDLMGVGGVLADIISKDLKIAAEVNQDDIEGINIGANADVRFFAYGNQLFSAKVRQILPSSDPKTQRFTVYLDLLKQPEGMLSGLTGEVSFFSDERENAIMIPRQALIGNTVFVVDGRHLELRKVTPGYLSYSDAEILDGVEEGELVVVEDVDFYRDGDRVHITEILGE